MWEKLRVFYASVNGSHVSVGGWLAAILSSFFFFYLPIQKTPSSITFIALVDVTTFWVNEPVDVNVVEIH